MGFLEETGACRAVLTCMTVNASCTSLNKSCTAESDHADALCGGCLPGRGGGLGGVVPPLVMVFIHGRSGSYGWGLVLLALVAASAMMLTITVVRSTAIRRKADASRAPGPAGPAALRTT